MSSKMFPENIRFGSACGVDDGKIRDVRGDATIWLDFSRNCPSIIFVDHIAGIVLKDARSFTSIGQSQHRGHPGRWPATCPERPSSTDPALPSSIALPSQTLGSGDARAGRSIHKERVQGAQGCRQSNPHCKRRLEAA